jgi:hypothetical protein
MHVPNGVSRDGDRRDYFRNHTSPTCAKIFPIVRQLRNVRHLYSLMSLTQRLACRTEIVLSAGVGPDRRPILFCCILETSTTELAIHATAPFIE